MSTITVNKKAYHDYEIIKSIEAGIVLTGPEVKSIKSGTINLAGGYISISTNKIPVLNNVHVAPYPPAFSVQQEYDPTQSRKLLLHKKQIIYLMNKIKIKGLTLIPLKVYTKKGLIKVEIGIAKGKKKWDKRETIKKRETRTKIARSLKQKM